MSSAMLAANRVGLRTVLKQTRTTLLVTSQRGAGYWNKDWRPADEPPTTEEGRRAAAKKYGLLPEDYDFYPSDDGYGDYPKLPLISAESRDPTARYDFPELKRNFCEPMHIHCDMVGEDKWNYNYRPPVPYTVQFTMLWGTLIGLYILYWMCEYVRIIPCPKMPRQFPRDKQTHYSFELEDVE